MLNEFLSAEEIRDLTQRARREAQGASVPHSGRRTSLAGHLLTGDPLAGPPCPAPGVGERSKLSSSLANPAEHVGWQISGGGGWRASGGSGWRWAGTTSGAGAQPAQSVSSSISTGSVQFGSILCFIDGFLLVDGQTRQGVLGGLRGVQPQGG